VEGLTVFGIFPIFHFPSIYGVLFGVMAFCLPAFTFLGVVDQPSQIQRKVMWRFPIVGGLIGYWLNPDFMMLICLVGWAAALIIVFSYAAFQRYVLRLFVGQFVLAAGYYLMLNAGLWWAAQAINVFWLLLFYRFLNAFLVKNLARSFVPAPPVGAS
jgi:hypothetical protein